MHFYDWTPAKVEKLKELNGRGYTLSQIATILGNGLTRNAVVGKLHRVRAGHAESRKSKRQCSESNFKSNKRVTLVKKCKPVIQIEEFTTFEGIVGIKLVELNESNCHWPVGDPKEDDFKYCGVKVKEGKSYCAHHYEMGVRR